MARFLVLALALLGSASAFVPASVQRTASSPVRMAVEGEPEPAEPVVEAPPPPPAWTVKDMAGVASFPGFFDPIGMSDGTSKARMMYYREAELKHSRVAMLAALGFLVAEPFHPLFGGQINVPSYIAFQQTPLQTFWPVTVLFIGVVEIFSVFVFESPFDGKFWTLKDSHKPGDYSFDPAGLKPTNPAELKEMQTKELNNGRLAMLAIAGMVGQELATGKGLF